jgi:hypothetical protein
MRLQKSELHNCYMKDRKRRPEEGEWEPQTSFEIFGCYPKTHHQTRRPNTVMSTTQLVGGCFLGIQRDTTKARTVS